ncbi:hypothetical protein L6R50_19805 [Myxococcota bacterium]|nr:hypothetical protein [Myxococcota bacterium]
MVTRSCQVCKQGFTFSGEGLGSSQAVPAIQREKRWVCRRCGETYCAFSAHGRQRIRVDGVEYLALLGHFIRAPGQDDVGG